MILSQGYKNVHNTTIVVIGGGAAGLAAAVNAAKSEFSVTIIDQNEQFGAKLLLTGGGHCNFSHAGTVEDLVAGFHGQGRFLYSALSRYGRDEYIRFLNGCGVRVTSDPSGRWLPSGGRATDVRDAFVTKVRQLGVRQLMSMRARTIKRVGDTWELDLQTNDAHTRLTARAVIIATGTAAYPSVGGGRDGLELAGQTGHSVIDLSAALAPIKIDESWVAKLAGVTLSDCGLGIRRRGEQMLEQARGELLFAHFGLTGPLPLSLSRWIDKPAIWEVVLDFIPEQNEELIYQQLMRMATDQPRAPLRNQLRLLIPRSVAEILLTQAGIPKFASANEISKKNYRRLAAIIKRCVLTSNGPVAPEVGMTCRGGVSLTEVSSKTMMSKKQPGIFFAGDLLDIDGHSGGYNLQAAFSTGMLAAESAVTWLRESTQ